MQEEQQLVLRKVAAREAGVTTGMITYWAQRGYIKKHYIFGNQYNYLVDLYEVLAQYELGIERKSKLYNLNWHLQLRGRDGTFIKKSE
jgi:hypothetical protein